MDIPTAGLLVEITQADIQLGQEGNVFHCPIALAVKRATKVTGGVIVLSSRIFVNRDEECIMPSEARTFAYQFDKRESVSPFTFTLIRKDTLNANLL
jgi:hypothetical protein